MSPLESWKTPRGTSLVEAIVSLGLLAAVLISASGLLGLGMRQIDSAGHHSRALTVAESVLAEASLGGWRRLLERLGCDPAEPGCRVEGPIPGTLAVHELPEPQVELRLAAIDATPLAETPALRILVQVSWVEGLRKRHLQLASLRV